MQILELTRVPPELVPAYRELQARRLLRKVRVILPAGAIVALSFIPWARMHDHTGQLPMTEFGILLSLGLFSMFLLTYLGPLRRHVEWISLSSYVYCVTVASIILVVLPQGFLYGVGTFLGFTVAATVIAVDVSAVVATIMAGSFLVIPNSAMALTDAPWITLMNTNWILISGGVMAFGLAFLMDQAQRNSFLLEHALAAEKVRGDALLSALLPEKIAGQLQETDDVIAEIRPQVTILFADLVEFTELTRTMRPEELINLLTGVFTTLDELAQGHGLEKIKTIGDAYMVAAGVADAEDRTSADVANFALKAIDAVSDFRHLYGQRLSLRVGMASGPAVSGVIGRQKPHFDLWGTTVNLASRLAESAPPGTVHIDATSAIPLEGAYRLTKQGQIKLRGIGRVETCLLAARSAPDAVAAPADA